MVTNRNIWDSFANAALHPGSRISSRFTISEKPFTITLRIGFEISSGSVLCLRHPNPVDILPRAREDHLEISGIGAKKRLFQPVIQHLVAHLFRNRNGDPATVTELEAAQCVVLRLTPKIIQVLIDRVIGAPVTPPDPFRAVFPACSLCIHREAFSCCILCSTQCIDAKHQFMFFVKATIQ